MLNSKTRSREVQEEIKNQSLNHEKVRLGARIKPNLHSPNSNPNPNPDPYSTGAREMRLESVFELLLEASGVRESTIFHLGNSSGVEDSQLLPQFKNQRAACCALLKAIACPDVSSFQDALFVCSNPKIQPGIFRSVVTPTLTGTLTLTPTLPLTLPYTSLTLTTVIVGNKEDSHKYERSVARTTVRFGDNSFETLQRSVCAAAVESSGTRTRSTYSKCARACSWPTARKSASARTGTSISRHAAPRGRRKAARPLDYVNQKPKTMCIAARCWRTREQHRISDLSDPRIDMMKEQRKIEADHRARLFVVL